MYLATDAIYRNKLLKKDITQYTSKNAYSYKVGTCKSHITLAIHSLQLMMAEDWAESIWEIFNQGKFINQFPSNILRSIRKVERIEKKFVDKKWL